jgi:hypothetical protein
MTLVFVVHPTDHDIRVYCLGLRLIGNSLFASSETKQAATPYVGAPWFVRNDALHKDLQIEPLGNVFRRNAIATYDRLSQHTNRLLTDKVNYEIWPAHAIADRAMDSNIYNMG